MSRQFPFSPLSPRLGVSARSRPRAHARKDSQLWQLPRGALALTLPRTFANIRARLTPPAPRGTALRVMAKDDGQEMWGGRFGGKPAELMREINASIRFD